MKPLFNNGKGLVQSMGNQGPIEPLVRGAYFYLIRFLFHNFSQVTNPPLAKDQEKRYMSLDTFIGIKVALDKLHNAE